MPHSVDCSPVSNWIELSLCSTDPPQFSPSTATAPPTEGGQLTFSFSIDAKPPPTSDNITLTRSGAPVTDARFTVTTTSLTIADVTRDDSGEYQITASTVVGSGSLALTVDVYCECVYMGFVSVHASLSHELMRCACTSSADWITGYQFLVDHHYILQGHGSYFPPMHSVSKSQEDDIASL